jgi:hypothetical protein
MGRPIAVVVAITLLALAAPAGAAEITHLDSSGEPNKPFEMDLSIRWERQQKQGKITREYTNPPDPGQAFGSVANIDQLRYSDVRNLVIPRLGVGLYEDLELHAELPYVLADEDSWRYASGVGGPSQPNLINEGGNAVNPDGTPCAGTCALFPVPNTVYRGGAAGDLKVGLGWGIFSDKKDDTKPYWLVGFDVTFPTAKLYDPVEGRPASASTGPWNSPWSIPSKVGPIGEKVWKFDFSTAFSRRMGGMDPYFRAHVTGMHKSNSTYDNCLHAQQLVANGQAPAGMVAACASPEWKDKAGAKLPWLMGLAFCAELVPYEDTIAGQKIAIDLRLTTDYTSSARWYNELTDATGRLLATDPYVTVMGQVGLVFRASEYVALQATGALGAQTSHYITGEGADGTLTNPNFDARYDAPGRRFRVSEVSLFNLMISGELRF